MPAIHGTWFPRHGIQPAQAAGENAESRLSLLAGAALAACFAALGPLPSLRSGANGIFFLGCYLLAGGAYWLALSRLERDRLPLWVIWSLAVFFRLLLLRHTPTLSDDVYRYIWDGHLSIQGANPYAWPVNSPALDNYSILARALVNHAWMASPYLPAAQLYFALVTRLAPHSALGFQIAAILLDLGTGWLVMRLLRRFDCQPRLALVYLWNPLAVVEFVHGAHVDALMVFLVMAALYLLMRGEAAPGQVWFVFASAAVLAAAVLTKGLPILLLPLILAALLHRSKVLSVRLFKPGAWLVVHFACIAIPILLYASGAGWGLGGPLDGRGLLGAIRIYWQEWSFNGGIIHWLGSWAANFPPGPASASASLLRLLSGALMAALALAAATAYARLAPHLPASPAPLGRLLLRLALIPLGGYLLFTRTVHPWYVTLVLPLLPFLWPADGEPTSLRRLALPWLYFSIAVVLSYLSYLHPEQVAEIPLVLAIEYIPFYALLAWNIRSYAWHTLGWKATSLSS